MKRTLLSIVLLLVASVATGQNKHEMMDQINLLNSQLETLRVRDSLYRQQQQSAMTLLNTRITQQETTIQKQQSIIDEQKKLIEQQNSVLSSYAQQVSALTAYTEQLKSQSNGTNAQASPSNSNVTYHFVTVTDPSKKYVVPEGKIWKINRSRRDETKYKSYRDSNGNWSHFYCYLYSYNEKGVNMTRSSGGLTSPVIVLFPGMYFTASLIKEVNDQETIISGAPVYVWYTEEDLPAGSTWK